MKTAHRKQSRAKRLFRDPQAINRVFDRLRPFTEAECTTLILPVRLAFEDIRNGNGSDGDYQTLADACNMCMARSEDIAPECVAVCHRAMSALERLRERWERIGRWGFDGPAILDIAAMLDLYEQVITLSTPQQIYTAAKEVDKAVRSGNFYRAEELTV